MGGTPGNNWTDNIMDGHVLPSVRLEWQQGTSKGGDILSDHQRMCPHVFNLVCVFRMVLCDRLLSF